jgi:hypothetical protein
MSDLVFIRAYANRFEAELAQQLLADQGIDAMVQADDAGGMYAGLSLGRKGVRLLVRAGDEARAREVLAEAPLDEVDEAALERAMAEFGADGDLDPAVDPGDDPDIDR